MEFCIFLSYFMVLIAACAGAIFPFFLIFYCLINPIIQWRKEKDQKEKEAIASSQVPQISSSESPDQQPQCSSSPFAPSPKEKGGYIPE